MSFEECFCCEEGWPLDPKDGTHTNPFFEGKRPCLHYIKGIHGITDKDYCLFGNGKDDGHVYARLKMRGRI